MTTTCDLPFPAPLEPARFVRRENRFLVTVERGGSAFSAHLHDPGRLREILAPGVELYLRADPAPGRKTAHTVVLARHAGVLVGINSALPNALVEACLRAGRLHEFRDYNLGAREKRLPGGGRVDFHLLTAGIDIYLEVKGASLVRDGVAFFPDAPTTRGTRQLGDLMAIAGKGVCGTVFFLVQREDASGLRPNDETDPAFAAALRLAFRKGLEILAYTSRPSRDGLSLGRRIPVIL
ncbi:MAG: DNA/RNA nuclease SfsA [Acidobacteria bacterium]|nr:DNA/RNA nuclease SfsA [Acidobacteriota bacterium]